MTESTAGGDLARALEYAKILRAAGDPVGAARLLDRAFDDEGTVARPPSEEMRFRALLVRADIALQLNDHAGAARARQTARTLGRQAEAPNAPRIDALGVLEPATTFGAGAATPAGR